MAKDDVNILRAINEILIQTTRMDKAIDRIERKIDNLSKK